MTDRSKIGVSVVMTDYGPSAANVNPVKRKSQSHIQKIFLKMQTKELGNNRSELVIVRCGELWKKALSYRLNLETVDNWAEWDGAGTCSYVTDK